MKRIAFDIDDVLWKIVEDTDPRVEGVGAVCTCGMKVKQVPDEAMMAFVQDLVFGDNKIFLWSAGGVDYVKDWIEKYAPAWKLLVEVIPKEKGQNMDFCFDDQEVDLATTNFRVAREHSDHWQEDTFKLGKEG